MDGNEATRTFGENLFMLIQQNDWPVSRAAEELAYGRNDLGEVIKETKNLKLGTAVRFARILNVAPFLMFSRQFRNEEYRKAFAFSEADYMEVFCKNFRDCHVKRSVVELDSATISKIMRGRYKNPTVKTLWTIAADASIPLSELLKTERDKQIESKEVTT